MIHYASCLDVAGSVVEQKLPLLEDLLLREFSPLIPELQLLQFGTAEVLSTLQEVCHFVKINGSKNELILLCRRAVEYTHCKVLAIF